MLYHRREGVIKWNDEGVTQVHTTQQHRQFKEDSIECNKRQLFATGVDYELVALEWTESQSQSHKANNL